SSLAACGRHGDFAWTALIVGAHRECGHGKTHRHSMGQGRSRILGPDEGRYPGAWHADLHPQGFSVDRTTWWPTVDPGYRPSRRSNDLRHALPCRYDRRISGRKSRANEHVAAPETANLVRPHHR